METGVEVTSINLPHMNQRRKQFMEPFCFSPDNRFLVIGHGLGSNKSTLWNLERGCEQGSLLGAFESTVISADGLTAATGESVRRQLGFPFSDN